MVYFVVESLNSLGQWFAPLAEMLLKGTALVMVPFALTIFLRRRSASAKHLVWLSAFCILALLPISQALKPSWGLHTDRTTVPGVRCSAATKHDRSKGV